MERRASYFIFSIRTADYESFSAGDDSLTAEATEAITDVFFVPSKNSFLRQACTVKGLVGTAIR